MIWGGFSSAEIGKLVIIYEIIDGGNNPRRKAIRGSGRPLSWAAVHSPHRRHTISYNGWFYSKPVLCYNGLFKF